MPSYDYTNYDFDALVAELDRLVAQKNAWKDSYQSSTGQVLIQLISAAVDQLHYMLERRSQENFLPSAKLKTSVAAISNLLGYRPKRITSPSGTLSFRLVDSTGAPIQNTDTITFPQYTKVTIDDNEYVIADETIINSPSILQWQGDQHTYAIGDHVEVSGNLWTCIAAHDSEEIIANVATLSAGVEYEIVTTGSTDFTLIGAADSNPGTVFTATDVGVGTGTVQYTWNSDRASNSYWSIYTESVEIEVLEGLKRSEQYNPANLSTTLGADGYILLDDYDNIAENSISVFSSTETYDDVVKSINGAPPIEALSFAKATDAVYDVRITHDGLQIVFGDNITGKTPDSIITVEWVESQDYTINVQSTNLDFTFDDSEIGHTASIVTDASANTYQYVLKNSTSIIGGRAAEDVDVIKAKVPEFTRSNARAVTSKDYAFKVLDSAIGSIVDVDVYGEKEIGTSSPSTYANNVYVNYLRSDARKLSQQNLQDLKDYMDNYKVITTHVIYQHAKIIPLQIGVTLKTTSKLPVPNSEVYDLVKNSLAGDFPFQEGSLDQNVYHSDIVNKFHDMTVVKNGITYQLADYVQVTVKPIEKFTTPCSNKFTITVTYGGDGDNYELNVNGFDYSYTSSAGDDADAVAAALTALLDNDPAITVSTTNNVITVDAAVNNEFIDAAAPAGATFTPDIAPSWIADEHIGRTFKVLQGTNAGDYEITDNDDVSLTLSPVLPNTVDTTGYIVSGYYANTLYTGLTGSTVHINNDGTDVSANLTIAVHATEGATEDTNKFFLPVQEIEPVSQNIVPGSVEIVNPDGTVIDTDDGTGNFTVSTNVDNTINYITGEVHLVSADFSAGNYAVRWDQNALQNVASTKRQAFTYDLPKDKYTDTTEKLSTIVITN